MPDQLQLRGGTTTEHNSFTGVSKEVTVDTTKKTLVVHDGSTAGGNPLMKENGGNAAGTVNIGTGGTNRLNISSSEIVFNESGADTDFRIEGDSSADLFKVDAGNNRIGIGTPTPDQIFTVRGGTDTVSIQSDDHPTSGQNKGGILGLGGMMNGNGTYHNWAELRGLKDNNSNNQNGGYLTFYTTTNGQSIAERMRITSGGNVGIGTATPARPLEIVGTVRVANDSAVEWGGTTTSIAGSSSSNTLFFTTNSGEKMRITSAGNVGIGGTAPNYQLHVVNNMAVGAHGFAQQLTFSSTAIQSLLLGTGYTNMSINALGGNVGIGTTSPNAKVTISETGTLTGGDINTNADGLVVDNNGGNTGLTFKTPNSASSRIAFGDPEDNNVGQILYNHSTDDLTITAADNIILEGDAVGIGTTAPSEALHVTGGHGAGVLAQSAGTTSGGLIRMQNTQGSTQEWYWGVGGGANNFVQGRGLFLRDVTGSATRFAVTTDGKVGIGTVNPRSLLDLGAGSGDGTLSSTLSQYQIMLEAPQGTGDYGRNIGWSVGTNGLTAAINAVDVGGSDATGLAFITGDNSAATERMRIDSSGKVGIGTTSPTAELEIFHATDPEIHLNINTHGDVGILKGDADGLHITGNGSSNQIRFKTNDSERMRIASSGNVGIGTTNPGQRLEVRQTAASHAIIACNRPNSDTFAVALGNNSSNNGVLSVNNTDLLFGRDSAGTFTERMRMTNDGDVGIGTTAPQTKLHVQSGSISDGSIMVGANYDGSGLANNSDKSGAIHAPMYDSDTYPKGVRLMGHYSSNTVTLLQVGGGTNSARSATSIIFYIAANKSANGAEAARLSTSGHFLVGTTSDNIGVNAATEGIALREEGHVVSRGTSSNAAMFTAKTTDTGGTKAFRVMLAQTEIGSIGMGAGGTTFNTSSDYRRKENVVALTDSITRLKTLVPKRFNFITEPGVTRDGFLAHEVTAVPEAITGLKDAVSTEADVTKGITEKVGDPIYQQLDQSKLVPLLTAALQEAITKIETLEAKVAALEAA